MASDDRVLFTINQRMNILKDLETSSVRDVAKKYKAHRSTIYRIQKNAKTIIDFANKGKLDKKRKSTRKPLCEELEQRLYEWFLEMRAIGTAISDAILIQKANELKEEFPVCSNFQASSGWIGKFKKRYEIRLVHIYGEKASADEDGVNSFVHNFEKYIEQEEISLENLRATEEGVAEDGHEGKATEEVVAEKETREIGLELPPEIRRKLENAFECIKSCQNYFPRSANCILKGLQLSLLGDTTSVNSK